MTSLTKQASIVIILLAVLSISGNGISKRTIENTGQPSMELPSVVINGANTRLNLFYPDYKRSFLVHDGIHSLEFELSKMLYYEALYSRP